MVTGRVLIRGYALLLLGVAAVSAQQIALVPNGPTTTAASDMVQIVQNEAILWTNRLQSFAYELFWALASLEMVVFCVQAMLKYRQNFTVMGIMALNKVLILGMFLALLANAPSWVPDIVNMFPDMGKVAAGIQSIKPSTILAIGLTLSGKMLLAGFKSAAFLDIPAAIAFLFAAAGVFLGFLILTLQFVTTVIETMLAVSLGYIFTAFGGSRWTAPYVERYFSYAVSAGVKLMSLYLFIGLGTTATQSWVQQVSGINIASFSVDLAWDIFAGVFIYVGVCWFVSKKVSGLLGGSPALSGSDGVGLIAAAMMAAGATATAATAATGIGAAASAGMASGAARAASSGATVATSATAAAQATPQPAAPMAAAASSGGAAAKAGGSPAASSAQGSSASGSSAGGRNGSGGSGLQKAVQTLQKMPHSGGNGAAPKMNGFGHGE